MKISEIAIYKVEAADKELGVDFYDVGTDSMGPYYKVNNVWYSTRGTKNQMYPVDPNYSLAKRLEEAFKEMMPFKGQLELF